jgi:hypothetical protein
MRRVLTGGMRLGRRRDATGASTTVQSRDRGGRWSSGYGRWPSGYGQRPSGYGRRRARRRRRRRRAAGARGGFIHRRGTSVAATATIGGCVSRHHMGASVSEKPRLSVRERNEGRRRGLYTPHPLVSVGGSNRDHQPRLKFPGCWLQLRLKSFGRQFWCPPEPPTFSLGW